jgi:hypothetical protein
MTLQRSALHPLTVTSGGSLQEQFGWELPQVYTDAAREYRAATEEAALHDASYVGRLRVTGDDALDLLNRLSTNQVLALEPGQGAPTILTTDRGRILDLIDLRPRIRSGERRLVTGELRGELRLEGVSFAYANRLPVLEDVSIEMPAGRTTAIVGATGSFIPALVFSAALIGLAILNYLFLLGKAEPITFEPTSAQVNSHEQPNEQRRADARA